MNISPISAIMPFQASINAMGSMDAMGSMNSLDAMNSMNSGISAHPLKPAYGSDDISSMGIGSAAGTAFSASIGFSTGSSVDKSNTSLKSFSHMLTDAIASVDKAQEHASDMTTRFAAGEPLDVHQVMIASQEANVALNLALQVRNKLTDAYTEIMHVTV